MTFSDTNINVISFTEQIKKNYRIKIALTLQKKISSQIFNANIKENASHFFLSLHNTHPVNAIVFTPLTTSNAYAWCTCPARARRPCQRRDLYSKATEIPGEIERI